MLLEKSFSSWISLNLVVDFLSFLDLDIKSPGKLQLIKVFVIQKDSFYGKVDSKLGEMVLEILRREIAWGSRSPKYSTTIFFPAC